MIRPLFVLQALVSLASTITLVVAPGLIPRLFGVKVDPSTYLLCYLIAASELSLAFLSITGFWAMSESTTDALVAYTIVFHFSSAVAGFYAIATGLPRAIWANVAGHVVVALAFSFALYRSFIGRTLRATGCQE